MTEPQLHPNTKRAIDNFLIKPTHGLMIVGPRGTGKFYVAQYLASKLLGTKKDVSDHEYIKVLHPTPTSISIEQIRELQAFLSLKVPGKNPIRRICIFEPADSLTIEAQNALLKILEEPPADTILVLLSEATQGLLPTIQSRVQKIEILPLQKKQLLDLAPSDTNDADISRAIALSNGRPGLFLSLLSDTDHPLNQEITQAKKFLTANQFERLILIQGYKEKSDIVVFLEALLITANAALKNSIAKQKIAEAKRWNERCLMVYDLQQKLELNVSTRLLLTSLALQM